MAISNSVKKRFVKDYSLPITMHRDDIFDYFIGLYDEHLDTVRKWESLTAIHNALGEGGFFAESQKVIDGAVNAISSSEHYATIANKVLELNKKTQSADTAEKRNIYHPDFVGELLISIDMTQANFNSLKYVAPQLFGDCSTYKDFIGQFTDYDYFKESKQIRQVIFGNLNPKAQQNIQRYIMMESYNLLKNHFGDGLQMVMTGPDEIIVTNGGASGVYVHELVAEIQTVLGDIGIENCHKVHPFILDRVGVEKSFYVKVPYDIQREIDTANGIFYDAVKTKKVEFKQVPSFFYPQVFKQYFGLETNEYDFMFYHEGHYAKFLTSVFGVHDAN